MLTNYHTHTTRCGHAEGTEEEYILAALRCGFKVLGFSDHTPWAYATPGFVSRIRMLPSQLDDYVLTLRGLREKYADKLHIRIGLEAEYFPAYLGWLKEEMERLDIEYLILGCHYDTTDEQDARASRFGGSTSTAHGRRYAEQVVEALETGLYRYLAHPDLFLNRVTAFDADAEKACRDICAAAARLDIPLEYNMAGLTLQDRPDGGFQMISGHRRMAAYRLLSAHDERLKLAVLVGPILLLLHDGTSLLSRFQRSFWIPSSFIALMPTSRIPPRRKQARPRETAPWACRRPA